MGLIDQTVPEKEKNKEWIKRVTTSILKDITSFDWERQKDITCKNLVNGKFNESDFDYLTKVGDYTYPARIRFVPIIKNVVQNLISDYSVRPFKFYVYAFDSYSIEKKIENKNRFFLQNIHKTIFDYAGNYRNASQQIQQILQQSAQAQQAMQQDPEGQAQQMEQGVQGQQAGPEHMILPPEVENELQQINEILNSNFMLTQEEIKKIDMMYKMSPREMYEIFAQKGMDYLHYSQRLDRQFILGFNSKVITDKPIYFVDYDETMNDPQLKKVNESNFYYSADNDIDLIQDGEWGVLDSFPSVATVLDTYRYELSEEDLKKLYQRNLNAYGQQYHANATYNGSCYVRINNVLVPIIETSAGCKLSKVYFKSPRKVIVEKKPIDNDKSHTRFYEQDELTEDQIRAQKEKGKEYRNKFLHDVYECHIIDEDIVIRARKKPYQFRSKDDYSVQLPFVGIAWKSDNRLSSSPVWDAKDIQMMYNIVFYFQELALALTGTKGTFMDKSQIPEGMSTAEWEYKKKMGTAYIETQKKGRPATFNQFQNYNEGLDASIQYYSSILEYLERLCGKIMGVPPERVGMIENKSAVGNNQQALRQSNLTTEIKFKEADYVRSLALERMANMLSVSWKNGKRAAYMFNGMQEILNIPEEVMNDARYRLFHEDGSKNKMAIDLAQSILSSKTAAGQIPLSNTIKLINVDSLTMLEKELKQLEDENLKIQQENIRIENESKGQAEQQTEQLRSELKMREIQLQGQIDSTMKKLDAEIKNMELELKKMELDMNQQNLQVTAMLKERELAIKEKAVQATYTADLQETESRRVTELAYLEEQAREFDLEHGLNSKNAEEERSLIKDKQKLEQEKKYAVRDKATVDRNVRMIKASDERNIRNLKTQDERNANNAKLLEEIKRKRALTQHEFALKQERAEEDSEINNSKAEEDMERQQEKHDLELQHKQEKHELELKHKQKQTALLKSKPNPK